MVILHKNLLSLGDNMIAVPVKTNGENPAITTLFGKAKWFALIGKNGVSIEKNESQSGRKVVDELVKKGVDTLIFNHIGGNPFMLLQKNKIKCFHSGDGRVLLNEALEKLKNDGLTLIDRANMSDFVEQNSMHKNKNHDHDHEHHEHEHHHHN